MKTRARIILVVGIAAVVGAAGAFAIDAVEQSVPVSTADNTATGAAVGGPFILVDAEGQTVTDQKFRGKWMLVYFGYTFCPDVCPTTLNNITQALAQLRSDANTLTPLFITIDPQRDTPKVIGDYVKAFDPRIVGLTGSVAQIDKVAHEYHVYYAKQPNSGDGKNDYLMDHSSFVYLMSPQGKFAKVMPGSLSGGEMANAIRPYLQSSS